MRLLRIDYCSKLSPIHCPLLNGDVAMLWSVGEGAAMVARSAVWWSVDGCRSTHTTTTRDATSTTAADNRRHRTLVFRQTHHSREVTGRRRPAGDEADEWRPTLQRCQCIGSSRYTQRWETVAFCLMNMERSNADRIILFFEIIRNSGSKQSLSYCVGFLECVRLPLHGHNSVDRKNF